MMLSLAATGMLLVSVIAFLSVDLLNMIAFLFGGVKSEKLRIRFLLRQSDMQQSNSENDMAWKIDFCYNKKNQS